VSLGIGVLGLGSVFLTPYRTLIERLAAEGRAELVAAYDIDQGKRDAVGRRTGTDVSMGGPEELIARGDVDVVLVLTSMLEHGRLALEALRSGKHVLVEKPMATELGDARALVAASRESSVLLICAPHVALSPTYREMHRRVHEGDIGRLVLARARYGWAGPWWSEWYYKPGGGSIFDLGIYNLTSLCGVFGSCRRVTALVGTAIPEREINGEKVAVQSDDNAHILMDFGDARFGSVTTGFTMQKYRSPAIELYGTDGVLQMMGDDWAPEGLEQWRNDRAVWEVVPETDPTWPWTDGLRHLVECVERGSPPLTVPEHAYHVLEISLAAKRSAAEGRAIDIESEFPPYDYTVLPEADEDERRVHDPRTLWP
jgi:predicted dehydrogenase